MLMLCPGLYECEAIDIVHKSQRIKSLLLKFPPNTAAAGASVAKTTDSNVRLGGKFIGKVESAVDNIQVMQKAMGSNQLLLQRKKMFHEALVSKLNQEYQVHSFLDSHIL
jgi:hypothetical protein